MYKRTLTRVHASTSLTSGKGVKLFVIKGCPYCEEAKQILDKAGVKYSTVVVPDENKIITQGITATKKKKESGINPIPVPQLMIGPHQIGSLNRIKELHNQGNLLRVLDQA